MAETKSPTVKFVDRRRLDDAGEVRPEAPPDAPSPAPAAVLPVPVPPAAAPADPAEPAPAEDDGIPGEGGPVRFEQILQSLVAPVQMMLSGQAGPVSREQLLADVNFTIEALDLLERKTRGRLTEGEARYLKSAGGSLKMIYMQLMNPPAGKA